MADLKKVKPGDKLRIPAATFNTFVDAARDFQRRQRDQAGDAQGRPLPAGQVYVKNASGADADRFAVLAITGPVFEPTDTPGIEAFQRQVALACSTPAGTDDRFVILAEPIAAGALGRAWVFGVCPVQVDVQSENHAFATADAGVVANLVSSDAGGVPILWKATDYPNRGLKVFKPRGMQTRSLGQIFATLAYRIKEDSPLLSLKVALHRQGKKRRFPTDAEFREALETRDLYDMRHCHYLLDRLENHSKEVIDTSSFTIEHVMPQNDDLRPEWKTMLGKDWEIVRETWLHRLGNLTLTGYNTEYSDRPFAEKKKIKGGFNDSPLRLNKFIREQAQWTAAEMEKRGKDLAAKALTIWHPLVVDAEAVKTAELEDRKAQAARYSLDKLDFEKSRPLFDALREQVLALGDDVIELCGPKSVTYRVFDFFLEVIPRKRRLSLLLNLDFEECDDPTQRAKDTSEYAFIIHASESGGVLFNLDDKAQLAAAMHVVRQAYEKVSE